MGEKELQTEQDFSKFGRVNHMLERRLLLLTEVKKISDSIDVHIYDEFSCETSEIFFKYHVESRWGEYQKEVLNQSTPASENIGLKFPFLKYLHDCIFLSKTNHTMQIEEPEDGDHTARFFNRNDIESDIERAKLYWEVVKNIFLELKECRAFEILRNNKERGNYLVSSQAKIIAMTCTHAGLKRTELIETGFEYDNIIIEEAGQILELETFIPFLLQEPKYGETNRLKRIVMIGIISYMNE